MRVAEVMTEEKNVFQVGGKELTAGQLLEQVGFNRSRQWTPVSDLSGGERRRLQLLKLMTGEPNVLMLDEPTNDLDTDTLAAVEDLLDSWPGTLVVVSHDRYLLERVTDHQVALLDDGAVRALPGGVEQYLRIRAGKETAPGAETRTRGSSRSRSSQSSQNSQSPQASAAPMTKEQAEGSGASGVSEAEKRRARKQMARVEKQMEQLTARQQRLHDQMAGASNDADVERLRALQSELDDVAVQLTELEEVWLEAVELGE